METFEHGGNIHKVRREPSQGGRRILDFSANINPLGPPEWLRPLISSHISDIIHYPDPENTEFIDAIAKFTGLAREAVVVGNGTTELLYLITRTLAPRRIVIPVPSYVDYRRAAGLAGAEVLPLLLSEKNDFNLDYQQLQTVIAQGDLVIIGSPNNPTGTLPDRSELHGFIKQHPATYFLIDEAFLDFIDGRETLGGAADNICTINSMTKFYGVPGLRIGYGLAPPDIVKKIREIQPPWTVNSFAQAVGAKALSDSWYQQETRALCNQLRRALIGELMTILALKVYPGSANYLFCKILNGSDTSSLAAHCQNHGIMIRCCDNYIGLDKQYFRIAVRPREENKILLDVLRNFFDPPQRKASSSQSKQKTPAIMFQGTCSNAGKSILTAAFCRIFRQDGHRVAPFKAQNMSLNSFVTLEGGEMGRAQVVQAQAARIDPEARMNPILLKPNTDTGSQVVVCGKPVGNMSVLEYNDYKPKVWRTVCDCYDSLAREFDIVVLEGAGSPGEVNLKRDDIVNMKMAKYAGAPVLLVGDIDRGGVYSSFVGIMEVLAEWERQLVAGFIVNKFRGQASLLDSAHEYVRLHTGLPVLGVVPHLPHLGLPEEDSVSFKKGSFNTGQKTGGIEIVVISLPHISNFTDIEPFLEEPDVTLRVVENVADVGQPQAIIIPGSKNVIHDMRFLKTEGFLDTIKECVDNGCELVGICGGYQILGAMIEDPHGIESGDGSLPGLGFLNMVTVIEKEKQLARKTGIHAISGKRVYGYEIHHGISTKADEHLILFDDGGGCGIKDGSRDIWGSYLHGIFDSDEFRRWFIDRLREKAGKTPFGRILAPYDLELAFERLAAQVRQCIDVREIYRLMNM